MKNHIVMKTTLDQNVKQDVRKFYDDIGWKEIGDGVYQNARYEDLRPVSWEYIHKCHLRVGRYLSQNGKFLLDAGSGPIQYPEYLQYSQGYQARVCADISIVALAEARQRIGDRSTGGQGTLSTICHSMNTARHTRKCTGYYLHPRLPSLLMDGRTPC